MKVGIFSRTFTGARFSKTTRTTPEKVVGRTSTKIDINMKDKTPVQQQL